MVKRVLLLALFLWGAGLYAESTSTITLRLLDSLSRGTGDSPNFTSAATGEVAFKSRGNRDVRAEASLDITIINDIAYVGINKAYAKVRLPVGRITMGKTRTTWGAGNYFNAGDVVFGGDAVDLTQDELKSQTRWLTSYYLPLGDLAFAEFLITSPELLPGLVASLGSTTEGADSTTLDTLLGAAAGGDSGVAGVVTGSEVEGANGGLRLQFETLSTQLEAGYMYTGKTAAVPASHNPSATLRGALLDWDWYLSSSLSINQDNVSWEDNKESLAVSAGLHYSWSLWDIYSLGLTLENLVLPYLMDQGYQLYGEITFSPSPGWNYFARNIVLPLDPGGTTTIGSAWNIYQGFSFLGFAGFQWGEKGGVYSFDNPGGWNMSLGMQYKF